MNTVRMSHPELPDQEIAAPESAVPIHRAAGWIPVGEQIAQPPAGDDSGHGDEGGEPVVDPAGDNEKKDAAKPPKSTSTRARAAEKE